MKNRVPEDPDIGDRKGSQPKKYHSGLSKSTKEKRDAHFKRGAKMDDDNPAAYKPAPGDKEAKTKPSVHTKKFKQMFGEEVTQKQIQDLEKFADRLLQKFNIDIEFTRHFADRMNDDRNKPAIKVSELQRLFKKISKQKGKDIRQNPDSQAVLKDIQSDLNLPVVINYDKNKDEFEVVNKTIMRKKDFKTSNKVIQYEETELDEAKYSVDVEGLPRFYMDADSPAKVKIALRKLLRKASSIDSIERVNDAKIRADLRSRIKSGGIDRGEVEEETQLDESSEAGLKKKAEKSGVSVGILRQVYKRGVAAWRTGHRPGTTPQQWGMARVNSFLTGGKTRTTADADLWKKAKSQKEEYNKYSHKSSIQESTTMSIFSKYLAEAKSNKATIAKLKKMGGDDAEMAAFLLDQGDMKELNKFMKSLGSASRKKIQSVMNESVSLSEKYVMTTTKTLDDAGEDKALSYGRKKGYKEAGVIGDSPIKAMVLFHLKSADKKDIQGANIKAGEQVFRYATRSTVAGDIFPLIKVNFNKGMVYYLTQESSSGEIDEVKFETRGQKLKFARLMSGVVKEEVELDEMYKITPDMLKKLRAEYGKIDKINPDSPVYAKLKKFIASMNKDQLKTIADADIKWLSMLAAFQLKK